jgi:hypothetical protein
MFPFLFTLGLLTGPAQAPQPAPANLEAEVRQALRRSALAGFVGTVTFQVELWPRPSFRGDPYILESWEVFTDGSGQLRSEHSWPLSDSASTIVVCETHALIWMTGLHHDGVLVLDKNNPPEPKKEIEGELLVIRNLAAQAGRELETLLDSPAQRRSVIQTLLLNRSPERTGAAVKIDGKLRQVTFRRVDGTLLLASITRDEAESTYRYAFKDHYQLGERWIPRTVEFEEHHARRGTLRAVYSQIELVAEQPNAMDFEKRFILPEPGDPAQTGIIYAQIYSKAFEGGVKTEATFFPQLDAMRKAQK